MTTTVTIQVSGSYEAAVKQAVDGASPLETVRVGPGETRLFTVDHDKINTFEITETYVAAEPVE